MPNHESIKGGCLCGNVRYEISGPLLAADNCHCSMCRRQHGAAFASYADFDEEGFKWLSGEEYVKNYSTPSGAGWVFCSECGSTMAGSQDGKIGMIALGTVDDDPGVKPEFHIFTGSKASWYDIMDNLPQYERRPSDG